MRNLKPEVEWLVNIFKLICIVIHRVMQKQTAHQAVNLTIWRHQILMTPRTPMCLKQTLLIGLWYGRRATLCCAEILSMNFEQNDSTKLK